MCVLGSCRLLVCGLELHPNLARRGLEGTMGWGGDYDEEQRVAAALGYVAHIVDRLAAFLDIPLRFPVVPAVSKSTICDFAPAHHQLVEDHSKCAQNSKCTLKCWFCSSMEYIWPVWHSLYDTASYWFLCKLSTSRSSSAACQEVVRINAWISQGDQCVETVYVSCGVL